MIVVMEYCYQVAARFGSAWSSPGGYKLSQAVVFIQNDVSSLGILLD